MTQQILDAVAKMRRYIETPGRVLDIGSMDINGSVRSLFTDASFYLGIDNRPGKGVDRVLSSHDLMGEFNPYTFDTVICCETLEHDPNPLLTIQNIHYVLKTGGYLIVSTPTFGFPLHRYPKDYWRFGEDAYREIIFDGYEILELVETKDPCIVAIGKKDLVNVSLGVDMEEAHIPVS